MVTHDTSIFSPAYLSTIYVMPLYCQMLKVPDSLKTSYVSLEIPKETVMSVETGFDYNYCGLEVS